MKNDTAYAIRDFIPDADAYIERWEIASREFRELEAAIGRARLNTPYGPHERMKFDLFHPAGPAEGLVVFVHGGYWRSFDRGWWSYLAAGATARGWAVAMPSYVLAPEASIAEITGQVARAITAAAGYVRGPVRLTGHSAGGHLVARMACGDVDLTPELRARIAKIVPIAPLTDLRPLVETTMNADFRMDEAAAVAESPALKPKAIAAPVNIWVGDGERPALIEQARWLSEAWNADLHVAPGMHHFDIIDGLADPQSPLIDALLG